MRKYSALIIIILSITLLFSCKSQRNIVSTPNQQIEKETKEKEEAILSKKISQIPQEFKTLSSKLSVEFEGNSFSGSIRIIKDSVVWISLGKFGIEGVRLMLRKDSVFMLNKLSRDYYSGGYEFIDDMLGFSLSYDMIQAIVLGKDFNNYTTNDIKTNKVNNTIILLFNSRQSTISPNTFPKLNQKIHFDTILETITRNYFEVLNTKQNMDIYYPVYLPFNNIKLPQSIKAIAYSSNKTYIFNLKFEKQKINESIDTPFSIPKSYTKINP